MYLCEAKMKSVTYGLNSVSSENLDFFGETACCLRFSELGLRNE